MKANEFFKKVGWERAKHCKKPSSRDNFFIVGGEVIRDQDLIELKRLVESYELVERFGGLEEAEKYIDDFILPELSRAIADVESCQ